MAERYNLTGLERTIALLADSKLGNQWCAEAAATVNYLGSLVRQRGEDITPHKAFFGTEPNVEHQSIFDCTAWLYTGGAPAEAGAASGT